MVCVLVRCVVGVCYLRCWCGMKVRSPDKMFCWDFFFCFFQNGFVFCWRKLHGYGQVRG